MIALLFTLIRQRCCLHYTVDVLFFELVKQTVIYGTKYFKKITIFSRSEREAAAEHGHHPAGEPQGHGRREHPPRGHSCSGGFRVRSALYLFCLPFFLCLAIWPIKTWMLRASSGRPQSQWGLSGKVDSTVLLFLPPVLSLSDHVTHNGCWSNRRRKRAILILIFILYLFLSSTEVPQAATIGGCGSSQASFLVDSLTLSAFGKSASRGHAQWPIEHLVICTVVSPLSFFLSLT